VSGSIIRDKLTPVTLPGGPAAIYGFLYQILRTAEWALRIDLNAPLKTFDDITIVAEPPSADILIESGTSRLVQQFKTRDGRWGLAEIIDDVLPNLYRSIADESRGTNYEFVTNGLMGNWAGELAFFKSLGSRASDGNPLASLDASSKRLRLRRKYLSERELFEEICGVMKAGPARDADDGTVQRKVWHLLARFDFVNTGDNAEAKENIQRLLTAYVLDDDQLNDKLARILDTVINYSTVGNRRFTAQELLTDSGIENVPFTKLPFIRDRVRDLTANDMRRLIRYEHSLSVRTAYRWEGGNRITVFSGESGQGKSWALADLAHDLLTNERGMFAVFVRATGDLQADIAQAVQRVFRDALGHLSTAPVEQIVRKVRRTLTDLHDPWLTVCIDDIRTASEIEALETLPLEEWGIRVAISTLPRFASHMALTRLSAVIEEVLDFSEGELREFLIIHDRDWSAIPADVRATMRRPLLAQLFVQSNRAWSPRNEYELYNACWQRLRTERDQPDHPNDVDAMLALASDFRDGGPYPWPRAKLREIDITDTQRIRLEAIGWLRETSGGTEIWHDRLLNWAVAEAITDAIADTDQGIETLAARLTAYFHELADRKADRPHLGYVPMDVVWMATVRKRLSATRLAALVVALETRDYRDDGALYQMLGTIGPSIVPALIERLRLAERIEKVYEIESYARDAIHKALADSEDSGSTILVLLQDTSKHLREIGIRLAEDYPSDRYATILWKFLLDHDTRTASGDGEDLRGASDAHWRRERLFNALAGSVSKSPEWLGLQILDLSQDDKHAKTLAWLLASVPETQGFPIWSELKGKLSANTTENEPSGLIACITRFRDAGEVPRLEAWLTSKYDFAGPSSLAALAAIAPRRALDFIENRNEPMIAYFSSWWLPWLLLSIREETLATAIRRLETDDAVPEWFAGWEHEVTPKLGERLIEHLSLRLKIFCESSPASRQPPFARDAHLLRRATQVEVIDTLRRFANTDVEAQLIAAIQRLPLQESDYLFDEAEDLSALLRRVSAPGASAAMTAILSRDDVSGRQIDWAAAYDTPAVREALHQLVARLAEKYNGADIPSRAKRAVRALATLGDDAAIIDAVWAFGPNVIDADVAWLTKKASAMPDALVGQMLAIIDDAQAAALDKARALAVLGVRRRPDLIRVILKQACDEGATPEMRWQGLRAAWQVMDPGTEVAEFVSGLVQRDHSRERYELAEVLFRSGTPASMDLLYELARSLPFDHLADQQLAVRLVDRSQRGVEIAKLLESHLFPFGHVGIFDDPSVWVRLFPALDSPEMRQKALDAADKKDSLAIIECVATFDRDAAFDLAVAVLRSGVKGREFLPQPLFRFNAKRALDTLIAWLPEEHKGIVRWSIARLLRWCDASSVSNRLREMASSSSTARRESAYDCAGWRTDIFTDEELRCVAIADQSSAVRLAALEAIRRRTRIRQATALRDRLCDASGADAWMLAEALVSHCDPLMLRHPSDPLCVYPVLESHSRTLRTSVEGWLEAREKKLEREADREDFRRSRRD